MTGRALGLAVLVLLGLVRSSTAWAAPTGNDAHARELFQQGDAAYAKGRYEQALFAFQEAYDLSGRPQLLYNISNALERLGRYSEAIAALEKYVASGKVKDKEVVEERLANLKKRVEQQKKVEPKEKDKEKDKDKDEEEKRKAEAEKQKAASEPPKEEPPKGPSPVIGPEKPLPIVPIVLLGTGGAALVAAGVFGVLTLSARSDLETGCKDGPPGKLCTGETSSALDRDYTFGLLTDIAAVSGVVLGGVGLYLLLTHKEEKPYVYVGKKAVVRPAGAGVELVGTF
jgi:tetratricopeptide (TPR) repeat protein